MSKTNAFETSFLNHLFNNAILANVGSGLPASVTAGSLYLSLHSASPGETAADQSINELSYVGYARVATARASGVAGWNVSGNSATLGQATSFGARTDTGVAVEATFFGIGVGASGATDLLYYGPLVGANSAYDFTGLNTGNTILVPGSAYSVNDRVVFSLGAESALPTGIADGQILYIKTASGTSYTLSSTLGGLEYDITVDGAGIVQRLSPITIAQNTTPQLTTGTKVIED